MEIECGFCGKFFQFETENEMWVNYNPNTHIIDCPHCSEKILIKKYVGEEKKE